MEFEWDENKRLKNIIKHEIDFIDARLLFRMPHEIKQLNYDGEPRWMAIGFLYNDIVSIVFTKRGDIIRLISSRGASKYERRKYKKIY